MAESTPASPPVASPLLSFRRDSNFVELGLVAAIAMAYILAGWAGLSFALPGTSVSPVFPPSGLALTVVLLFGPRVWPGIWLGANLINLVFFYDPQRSSYAYFATSLAVGAGIGTGSSLQALLGRLLLLRWVGHRNPLDRARDVFKFSAVALLMCLVSSTVGVTSMWLGGMISWDKFPYVWWTFWLGDTVGVLVTAPLILAWSRKPIVAWTAHNVLEAVVLSVALLVVAATVFGLGGTGAALTTYPLEYMTIPFLLWAAFRFGLHGATATVTLLSVVAVVSTAKGVGPFTRDSFNVSLLLLQAFLAVISVTTLSMAGLLAEEKQARGNLEQLGRELEQRVIERTHDLKRANDELQQTTADLEHTLSDLKNTQGQLIQNEKMASLGQMVAGVAHEINNPVNFISGANANLIMKLTEIEDFLFRLMGDEDADSEIGREIKGRFQKLQQILGTVTNGVERVKKIVKGLRVFSRLDEATFKAVDLHEGIDSTLDILQFKLKGIEVAKDYSNLPLVECQSSEINQVVMNLVANAIQALEGTSDRPAGGQITIRTHQEAESAVISVADTGCGIPKDKLGRIFDPFYTTKAVGQGTGLGLSISYGIVQKHKGRLEVESELGVGTTFRIVLPIRAQPQPPEGLVQAHPG